MGYRPSKRRRHHIPGSDINIIPLMNVFVIIIPFLLLTAVFAKTAIIDILLPEENKSAVSKQSPATSGILTVSVTDRGFKLGGIGGRVNIPRKKGGLDFGRLAEELVKIKDRHPRQEEVVILLDPRVPYDLVIQVMDATRETTVVKDGRSVNRTLFPVVSLGENR